MLFDSPTKPRNRAQFLGLYGTPDLHPPRYHPSFSSLLKYSFRSELALKHYSHTTCKLLRQYLQIYKIFALCTIYQCPLAPLDIFCGSRKPSRILSIGCSSSLSLLSRDFTCFSNNFTELIIRYIVTTFCVSVNPSF